MGQVRGRKMMQCVENVADKVTKRLLPEELDVGKRIADECEGMGLMVRPMVHLNVMSPPLTMTEADADFIVKTLERAIGRVADRFVKQGVRLG